MKRILWAVLVLFVFACGCAAAETAQITAADQLLPALGNDSVDKIEITADMTITDSMVYLTKDTVILSDVIFKPAPDDGFFVKSLLVPEGVTLSVKGKLTTEHTFDTGFAIAQIYLTGGTLDLSEGIADENLNICYEDGKIIPPSGGFAETVSVAAYLYDDTTEAEIVEVLQREYLNVVTVQTVTEITGQIVIPEGKTLVISAYLIIDDGASITGSILVDAGCGAVLIGSAVFDDLTVPDGAQACVVTAMEDGSIEIVPCTVEEIEAMFAEEE